MQAFSLGAQFARESAMLKLPEERGKYRKCYYFYSPQSSTVIKSKMAATTILRTRTRFPTQNTPVLQANMVLISHLFFLGVKTLIFREKKCCKEKQPRKWEELSRPEVAFRTNFHDKAFVNYHLLSDLQILISASCQALTGR